MYYDLNRILTYNAFLNILIGERGVGKTFSTTKFVINQFLKKGHEFVYIRRYKTELSKSLPKFFDSIIKENVFPDTNFSHKGNNFYINDKIAGYGLTLSTAQSIKSANFPKVKYIIFDEFIAEGNSHYLKNEVEMFLGLIESIARMRNVVIILLGNAVTITNPYFLYFDLTLPYNSDIKLFKDGLILVQYMKNEEYRKNKKESKFGMLVSDTEYSNYAIDNNFRLDNKNFIEKKSGTSKFSFAFKFKDSIFGVWFDFNIGKIFVSYDYLENGQLFVCTLDDMTPNTMLLSAVKNYNSVKLFIKNYKLGNVYYESVKIKNCCYDLIKLLVK